MIENKSDKQLSASQNHSGLLKYTKAIPIWLVFLVPSIVIVLTIWLPFGFAMTGLIEEWGVLGLFNTQGFFFIATTNSPLAAHILRPLTILPHAVAYFFDPNSFAYWHVLLILALIVKGCTSSHLIWKATSSIRWAMAMGALVLVYPADTMQLSFRSLHINWALSFLLLASSIFVVAYEQKRLVVAYSLGAVAATILFVANCMYEVTLMLLPLPLLILFVRDGFNESFHKVRARVGLLLVWGAGAGLYIIYVVRVTPAVTSYQSSIVGDSNSIVVVAKSLPKLFSLGMFRALLGGWFDAVRMVSLEYSDYAYLLTAILIIGILALIIERSLARPNLECTINTPIAGLLPLRLAIAGLLLLLLGYAPFLVSTTHLATNQRTFLYATPGAAMVWIALLIIVSRSAKLLSGLATLALVFFGLGAQLFQFHHYIQIAEKQRTLLRGIVENFDGNLGDKTLLLLDGSNQLGHTWMLNENLRYALSYLYGHPLKSVEVCYMPSKEWQRSEALGCKGTCIEGEKDWVFRFPAAVSGPGYVPAPVAKDQRVAKSKVITITINPDGSAVPNPMLNDYRNDLISGKNTVALRYRGVLEKCTWPFIPKIFEDQKTKDTYRWDFGDWWSLELPTRGAGWREAEWKINRLYHQSSAWKTQEKSALYFDFLPTTNQYFLRGKFSLIISEPIRKSIQIRLNNNALSYRWISVGEFEAEIRPNTLLTGANEIEFNSTTAPNYYGLSAMLDWFEIHRK